MRYIIFLLFLTVLLALEGCYINANLMLKTDKNHVFDSIPKNTQTEYLISPNDNIQFKVFSNDGTRIVDISVGSDADAGGGNVASTNVGFNNRTNLNFRVELDSFVRLPVLDTVKIAGYTIPQAESLLEKLYSEYYVEPYVQLQVTNKRVIVFPGNGGKAQVLNLLNNNTTVIEALALSGGIQEDGKAYKVKLIRNDGSNKPKVYLMDLSKISGITVGNTVVLANDIIYVEPRYRFAKTVVGELTPVISLLTSTLLIYTIFIKK